MIALLLPDRVSQLKGSWRAVGPMMHGLQGERVDSHGLRSTRRRAECGIDGLFAGVIDAFGAGRWGNEKRVGEFSHAPWQLLRAIFRVGVEDAVEEGLQVRFGVLVDAEYVLAVAGRARVHFCASGGATLSLKQSAASHFFSTDSFS